MRTGKPRRAAPPLNETKLQELALRYVGKYATTRAKLRDYLARKVRERGWAGAGTPEIEALAERLSELGYVDDRAYALAKSQALSGRGYGRRRVEEKLRLAGIEESDGDEARRHAQEQALSAALRFARRRKLGPFAVAPPNDPKERQKALAAMIRAGHPFAIARAILALSPGSPVKLDELGENTNLTEA